MKVIIMRGLPGSGKSSYASQFATYHVVSADDYFHGIRRLLTPSERLSAIARKPYVHNALNLPLAHQQCFRFFLELVRESEEIAGVIVDNTNLNAWEVSPYVLSAESYGHDVEIVQFDCDPATAFKRNIHRVPLQVIDRMADVLRADRLPHWYNVRRVAN